MASNQLVGTVVTMQVLESAMESQLDVTTNAAQPVSNAAAETSVQNIHILQKPSLCEDCNILFPSEEALITHRQSHRPPKMYLCTECSVSCDSLETLQAHLQVHPGKTVCIVTTGDNTRQPNETPATTSSEPKQHDHSLIPSDSSNVKLKSPEKSSQNLIAKDTETMPGKLEMFIKAQTWEESYIYNEEEMTSLQSREFELQLMTPEGERQYSCTEVDKKFQRLGEVSLTIRTGHGMRYFLCMRSEETTEQPDQIMALSEVPVKIEDIVNEISESLPPEDMSAVEQSQQNLLLCTTCHSGFISEEALSEHMKLCTSSRNVYLCLDCNETVSDLEDYQKHRETNACKKLSDQGKAKESTEKPARVSTRAKKTYFCDECHEVFSNPLVLKGHKNKHKGVRPYVCEICQRSFYRPDVLQRHAKIHDYKPPNKCDVCGQEFFLKKKLEEHMKIHSGNLCNYCNMHFSSSRELRNHILSHEGDNVILCRTCGTEFSNTEERDKHENTSHTETKPALGKKPFLCKGCGILFSVKEDLLKHIQTHKGEKPYLCKDCGKGFTRSDSWKDHCRTHSGKRPYLCEECGKSFVLITTLRKHVQVWHPKVQTDPPKRRGRQRKPAGTQEPKANHEIEKQEEAGQSKKDTPKGDSKMACSICGKMFPTGAKLMRHERTHSEDGHYMCKKCGKMFKYKYNLWRHEAKHKEGADKAKTQNVSKDNSKPPYFCSICDKTYLILRSFQGHMRSHAEKEREKIKSNQSETFVCEECSKVFSSSDMLEEHLAKHFGVGAHKCHLCNSRFKYEKNLKRHLGNHVSSTFEKMLSKPGSENEVKHVCLKCNMMYETAEELKEHSECHLGSGEFKCEVCDQRFKFQRNLDRHSVIHKFKTEGGEKVYGEIPCTMCEKTFFTEEDLQRHMKRHTGDGPHMCEFCGKRFKHDRNMKRHMEIHGPVKKRRKRKSAPRQPAEDSDDAGEGTPVIIMKEEPESE